MSAVEGIKSAMDQTWRFHVHKFIPEKQPKQGRILYSFLYKIHPYFGGFSWMNLCLWKRHVWSIAKIGRSHQCVCVCECVSVCEHSHGWTVWHTDPKFGGGVDLDNISYQFEGQGHVTSWRHVTSWYDVMTSRHDVLTSFDDFWARILTKRARRGRARQRSGVFILSMLSSCFSDWSHSR